MVEERNGVLLVFLGGRWVGWQHGSERGRRETEQEGERGRDGEWGEERSAPIRPIVIRGMHPPDSRAGPITPLGNAARAVRNCRGVQVLRRFLGRPSPAYRSASGGHCAACRPAPARIRAASHGGHPGPTAGVAGRSTARPAAEICRRGGRQTGGSASQSLRGSRPPARPPICRPLSACWTRTSKLV